MNVYTKLSTITDAKDKELSNLSFEDALTVIVNRLKYPNASEYNVAGFIFDAALRRILRGEDAQEETSNTKSKTETNNSKSDKAKNADKKEDVS